MIGVMIAVAATFFQEISSVIAKDEISRKRESLFTAGFLTLFWGTVWFGIIILYKGVFLFSLASLPTLTVRVILEIIVIELTLRGLVKCDRTTFGFLHAGTVPLLLVVDIMLGYHIDAWQFAGIALFCGLVIFLITHHGIRKKGTSYIIMSTIIAVGTISLYKYNITHFNAPETEQFVSHVILLLYLLFAGTVIRKENPFAYFLHPRTFTQSFSAGIASVAMSFAYLFAPASIIVAAKRIGEIFWSTISGGLYYHERHIFLKIGVMAGLIIALLLLIR